MVKSFKIFLSLNLRTMATNFSPCWGSYVLDQFTSIVMSGMKGFDVSASGAIQGHHGPLVSFISSRICEKVPFSHDRSHLSKNRCTSKFSQLLDHMDNGSSIMRCNMAPFYLSIDHILYFSEVYG